jgi:hypothetical protein
MMGIFNKKLFATRNVAGIVNSRYVEAKNDPLLPDSEIHSAIIEKYATIKKSIRGEIMWQAEAQAGGRGEPRKNHQPGEQQRKAEKNQLNSARF